MSTPEPVKQNFEEFQAAARATQRKHIAHLIPEPPHNNSFMEILAALSVNDPKEYLRMINVLETKYGEEGLKNLKFEWDLMARPKQMRPEPSDAWRTWVTLAGRGWGKEICISTPIKTETGWKEFGKLTLKDRVFDETGNLTKVTAIFDTNPIKCYRLHFNDGTYLDAGKDHQWITWDGSARTAYLRSKYEDKTKFPDNWPQWKVKRAVMARTWLEKSLVEKALELKQQGYSARHIAKTVGANRHALAKHLKAGRYLEPSYKLLTFDIGPKVRTTQDIVNSLYRDNRSREDLNHCIPNCAPLNLPEALLPIPAYSFGIWAGDGSKSGGSISSHEDDMPFTRAEIEKDGFGTYTTPSQVQMFSIRDFTYLLTKNNLKNNKHIPDAYLNASIEQRLALLQGLMDSDGGIDGASCVSFTNTNKQLADAVYELVISLGMKAYRDDRIPKCEGKECNRAYRINFVPTMQIFRLPRKANLLKFSCTQLLKRHHRMIISAEEISVKPMRCITVDSPNSMYLVGEQMIPTHNTKVGAQTVIQWADELGDGGRIALVGATAADVNHTMIGGDSGILKSSPPWNTPIWSSTNRTLKWKNGCIAESYSSEEPERLRGPQQHKAWADELAAWRYQYAWEMLMFGLRLGDNPQVVVTTTPKPVPILMDILKLDSTWTTVGTTYENRANLAKAFFEEVIKKYEGSRLGQQELMAAIMEKVEGALWNEENLDNNRIKFEGISSLPEFSLVVLAIDPATTTRTSSAETGMCVAAYGTDDHFYILHLDSYKESPENWAMRSLKLFEQYECDRLVAEVNNGGDLVEAVIRAVNPMQKVYGVHASRGKVVRAEPIAALYEKNRVHHIGTFAKGEEQMTTFNPIENPYGLKDCVDALVWAMTKLVDETQGRNIYKPAVGGLRSKLAQYAYR